MWIEAFKLLGGSAILIGALTYLSKVLIEHLFSKDLQKFKEDTRLETERNKFIFEALHAKRGEIIASIYGDLIDAEWAIESLIRPMQYAGEPTEDSKKQDAAEKFNIWAKNFQKKQIYFPENLAHEIEGLRKELHKVLTDYSIFSMPQMKDHSKLFDIWENFREKKIPPIKLKIEKEIRELIGVN